MKLLLFFCFFLGLVWQSLEAGCHSSTPDYGPPNLYPISEGSQNMQLVKTVKNGKLYTVTVPNSGGNSTSTFNLVHVWGTPYEMGFAQGQLTKDVALDFIQQTWAYLESEIENVIPFFPDWLQKMIADLGLDFALDMTYYFTRFYSPDHFYDEMNGITDGVMGSDPRRDEIYNLIVRVHMIASLTQGACSMIGAWGPALDPNSKTKLLQLRALDWDMDGPFRNYPQVTVYHPNADNGHAFVNIGIMDFIGGLTGLSQTQLAISEIGASYPDDTFGSESRIGLPFIFLLRDILQYDYVLEDAINRMANAHRTCNLILGVGDGKETEFRGFEYSYSVLDVFSDMNMRPYNQTWHPRIPGLVYWGMDWDCPAYNTVLSQQLLKYYGQITPEIAIKYFTSVEMSGDNHLAYYDLTNNEFWVSFAAKFSNGGPVAAYARQFTHFKANDLFNEPKPN
jgi:isopenicillin-N N-acyltransferase-like protein